MTTKFATIVAIFRVVMLGGCWWWWSCSGLWGDDEFQQYAQRTDAITMSGGDAKEVNAVTHTIHPWPRGVGDPRIITDSAHMERALQRYRRGARPPDPMPDLDADETAFGVALPPEQQGVGAGAPAGGAAAPSTYPGQ
jgi:hypothetical protein